MKTVRIDKDYCSDPVWLLRADGCFSNDSLSSYSFLSAELLADLINYSNTWEKVYWGSWDREPSLPSGVGEAFEILAKSLAIRCKLEAPEISWCYWSNSKREEIYV